MKGSETMTEKNVSPDVKALKKKKLEIENEICELYMNANLVIAAGSYVNDDDWYTLTRLQKACLSMLQAANE